MGVTVKNQQGIAYGVSVEMVTVSCTCGLPFMVPQALDRRWRDTHDGFYCPLGHPLTYHGLSEAEKQKARADRAEREAKWAKDSERFYRDQATLERRRVAAYKGQITKMKNKIHAGICPVKGCSDTFPEIRQHMRHDHKDWLTEHPEVLPEVLP